MTNKKSRFTEYLDKDFRLNQAQIPPSKKSVRDAGLKLGFNLPNDYIDFISEYGAVYLEVKEDVWPRAKAWDVAPHWTFQYARIVFGIPSQNGAKDVPEWVDFRIEHKKLQKMGRTDLLPIYKEVVSSDYTCFTKKGELVLFFHDDNYSDRVINATFIDYWDSEVKRFVGQKQKRKSLAK